MIKKLFFIWIVVASITFSQINFDANFESGNLASVTQIDSNYFEVQSREDIGGRWFYFRMSGVKDKHVKVNVVNSDANRPFYSYDNINFTRFTETESPYVNYFEKTFDEDTVYVAYYTPYTFSHLMNKITEWKQSELVFVDTLGYTQMNLPIQEIIITDPFTPQTAKTDVWIHARTHPGETPSSFQFEGIINELLKDDEVIDYYRKNVVFHLIPFTNPDGVYYGRSRTNFNGVDVEREWNKPMNETCLEVQALKTRMSEINSVKPLAVFLNLHSQTAPYCTFWIHSPGSTSERFYRMEYQFANLNTSDNPYFVPDDYSHSDLRDYFPEGFLWNTQGENTMALTYETPYDQYSNNDWVTDDNLREIGKRTLYASMEYLQLSHPKRLLLDDSGARLVGFWYYDTSGLEFFGDGFLTAGPGQGENMIIYETEELNPGKYDIYGWWPSSEEFSFNTDFNIQANQQSITLTKTQRTNGGQWNFLIQTELNSKGKITITLKDNPNGKVAADAFRILYAGLPSDVNESKNIPNEFVLYQNYPNPFNPSTNIEFKLNKPGNANLSVYDVLGRKIAEIVNGYLKTGNYRFSFNPGNFGLASGVYIYKLSFGNKLISKKMIYLK